jgi:protein SCO1/2
VGAVVAGIGIGTYLTSGFADGDPFADCREGQVAGTGDVGGDFSLLDEAGNVVTAADVITKPTLVYFGYTFCPDVCPLDTVRNADAVDLAGEKGHDIQPVFITVDPARDTPDALADFTGNIHDDMLGLTGSDAQIADVADAYRVYYRAHNSGDEYYLVDHSTFSYFMHPELGFLEFFRRDVEADVMANRMACFLDAV